MVSNNLPPKVKVIKSPLMGVGGIRTSYSLDYSFVDLCLPAVQLLTSGQGTLKIYPEKSGVIIRCNSNDLLDSTHEILHRMFLRKEGYPI